MDLPTAPSRGWRDWKATWASTPLEFNSNSLRQSQMTVVLKWPTDFPVWGTAADLVDLIDVKPDGEGRFASPSFPDPPPGTFFDIPDRHRPRQVVEGGHLLGQAIMAASKTVPDQRVVSASMVFTRAARFDAPLAVDVEVLHRGRTYSTVQTRTVQNDKLCSVGLVLLDSGAEDIYRGTAEMPDVAGPLECPLRDFGVIGRDIRSCGRCLQQQSRRSRTG